MYIHTLCFELQLILDLVHVPFMMLDANGSIPHTQAQQHHSWPWATRNTFVIVTAIAIVTAVVIVMLSVTCIKDQACEPVQRLLERAQGPCPHLPIPLLRSSGQGTALPPPVPAHALHTLDTCHCISCRGYHLGAASAHTRLARLQTS